MGFGLVAGRERAELLAGERVLLRYRREKNCRPLHRDLLLLAHAIKEKRSAGLEAVRLALLCKANPRSATGNPDGDDGKYGDGDRLLCSLRGRMPGPLWRLPSALARASISAVRLLRDFGVRAV